jgi:hypothetical protein
MKNILYGLGATGLVNLLAIATVWGEEIIVSGLIIAICTIFAFSVGIRLMIASSQKESIDGGDAPTDWVGLGWYSLGAAIAAIITLIVMILAIANLFS